MAFDFTHINAPGYTVTNGGRLFYALKEALKAKGWTHVASGDGIAAFSTVTDQITSGASGANGFDNTRAWICLQQPTGGSGAYAGTRQICIQIGDFAGGGDGFDTRIVYSLGGTADTSSSDANVCPTFSDEVIIAGGGTPAAPTFVAHNPGGIAGNVDKYHIVVGGAAENFAWWITGRNISQPFYNVFTMMFDPVLHTLAGDDDPFVIFYALTLNMFVPSHLLANPDSGTPGAAMFTKFAIGGHQRVSMDYFTYPTMVNSRNGKDDLYPITYKRQSTNGGYKGYSSIMRHCAVSRSEATLFNVNAAGDFLKFGDTSSRIALSPWDNTTP